MRKKQKEEEILAALGRIEHWQLLTVEKLNKLIAAMEEQKERPQVDADNGQVNDKWLQDGIDSIMSFQAGKKREGEQ